MKLFRSPAAAILVSNPSFLLFCTKTTTNSCSPPQIAAAAALTDQQISMIRRLVPKLCTAGNLHDAGRLVDSALLAGVPADALPLQTLTDYLADATDMSAAMFLLTAVRQNPRRPSPLPICSLLLSNYLRRRRFKEASKIVAWICRSDSPCCPDAEIYATAISGFCRLRRPFEALRVLREMVRAGAAPPPEMREKIRRALLWEARIEEAREIDEAFRCDSPEPPSATTGDDGQRDRAAKMIDRIIECWEDIKSPPSN